MQKLSNEGQKMQEKYEKDCKALEAKYDGDTEFTKMLEHLKKLTK